MLYFIVAIALITAQVEESDAGPSEVELRLARDPDDPILLQEYASARGRAGDRDGELANLFRALDAHEMLEGGEEEKRRRAGRAIEARIAALDRGSQGLSARRDKYLAELTEVLRLYANNQGKPKNALDIAGRILAFRPDHATANQIVEQILSEADEEILQFAARALARRELRRPRSFRHDWAREHREVEDAGLARTRGYYMKSCMPYEATQRAAASLEQISTFYRKFYGVTPEAGQFGRTKVHLYRTREQFERFAPMAGLERTTVLGFLSWSMRNGLHTFGLYSYDPRDDGLAREDLYRILFHEASHQYMALAVAGGNAPSWLNEGMACYFEGASIDRNGEVQVGLPAYPRLDDLARELRAGRKPLMKTLRARTIAGEQYPVAWGLVYYLHHHQTEDGRHPYRPTLEDAIARSRSYRGPPEAIFEQAVLEAKGLSFEEFEAEWIAAMLEFEKREAGHAEVVAWTLQRARRFLEEGSLDAAAEAFHQVSVRDPQEPRAYLGLAQIAAQGEDADEILLAARRAFERADGDSEQEIRSLIRSVDQAGFKLLEQAERTYRSSILKQVGRHRDASRPKTAIAIARYYIDRVLGDSVADDLIREFLASDPHGLDRLLLPFDGESLFGLSASASDFRVEQGELIGVSKPPRAVPLFVEEPVARLFRLEGEIRIAAPDVVVSFCVTLPESQETVGFSVRPELGKDWNSSGGASSFGSLAFGHLAHLDRSRETARTTYYTTANFTLSEVHPLRDPPAAGEWIPFALSLDAAAMLRLELSGSVVAERSCGGTGGLDVTAGLLLYNGETRIRNLRVIESGRF